MGKYTIPDETSEITNADSAKMYWLTNLMGISALDHAHDLSGYNISSQQT